jgi:hypothetical protein
VGRPLPKHASPAEARATTGFTEWALQLGPFGGAELGGTWLPLWTVAYLAGVLGLAVWAFARRDL